MKDEVERFERGRVCASVTRAIRGENAYYDCVLFRTWIAEDGEERRAFSFGLHDVEDCIACMEDFAAYVHALRQDAIEESLDSAA